MDAYDEVYVYTMGRKNFILQHVVDVHIAQGATATNPPSIGAIFSLAGLYLHVEKGFTGTQVQNAHRVMGKVKRSWPDIIWPTQRGNMTASDVLAMPAGQERDEAIHEWCKQVWAAFGENRAMVVSLLSEYRLV
jgi:hypothetical protein